MKVCEYMLIAGHALVMTPYFANKIVKTQRNSTQLNPTLKQLALELDPTN